jgi:hypothetical protein
MGLPFRGTPLPAVPVLPRECSDAYCHRAILLRRGLHDRDISEDQWDRCSASSLHSSDDSTGVWILSASPDQWWGVEFDGGGSGGLRVVHLGFDPTCSYDCVAGPVSVHRQGGVRIWLHPGGLLLGEGADAVPEGAIRGTRGTRAALATVVRDIGSPRRWRRRALLHCGGSADMATDAAGYSAVPLCWGGFSGGPRYGVASWGGVRPQRYVMFLGFVIYVMLLIY